MQINLTAKEFRRLLDLVYIGNWVLNSTRGEDRFQDYDDLERFSPCPLLCRNHGTEPLSLPGHSQKVVYTKPSLTMRTMCFTRSWPKNCPAGI